MQLLLEREDIEINANDNEGCTPFILVAKNGYETLVRLLMERENIEINAKDNKGKTALSWAVATGHTAIVELLNDLHDVQTRASGAAPADSRIGDHDVGGGGTGNVGGAMAIQ